MSSAPPLTFEQVTDVAFWRDLRPDLSIERARPAPVFDVGDTDFLWGTLLHEGYVNVPGVVSTSYVQPIFECVRCLHARGIPLPFAFVYDELWEVFQGVAPYLSAVLGDGYRMLPAFWAWFLPPSDEAAGWGAHRDRLVQMVTDDNVPLSLTVWLPFSDATPLNGCVYVIPMYIDDYFERRVWDETSSTAGRDPRNIRALPATAGSMLSWNQGLLHWGGRASRLAPVPRCSAAFEFQRGDVPPFFEPLLDPTRVPTFGERLGLVARQILQYQHMYPLAPEVAETATRIYEGSLSRR